MSVLMPPSWIIGIWTGLGRVLLGQEQSMPRQGYGKSLPRIISIYFFFALQVNFVLFIGIIVILVQKLQSPDMGGNESSIYL